MAEKQRHFNGDHALVLVMPRREKRRLRRLADKVGMSMTRYTREALQRHHEYITQKEAP